MKALDHDACLHLLEQTSVLRLQGERHPPTTAVPLEAKRAARALLRMKPAR